MGADNAPSPREQPFRDKHRRLPPYVSPCSNRISCHGALYGRIVITLTPRLRPRMDVNSKHLGHTCLETVLPLSRKLVHFRLPSCFQNLPVLLHNYWSICSTSLRCPRGLNTKHPADPLHWATVSSRIYFHSLLSILDYSV
jgi:hypothetical protein